MNRPKYTAIPMDTDLNSARRRFSILRKNKPSERIQMALELSDSIRETVIAGIKRRHPDFSPDMVKKEAIRLTIGEKLFQKYFTGNSRA